jgi:hypothetical protein
LILGCLKQTAEYLYLAYIPNFVFGDPTSYINIHNDYIRASSTASPQVECPLSV